MWGGMEWLHVGWWSRMIICKVIHQDGLMLGVE